jgi:DNA-binding CsgD family transcriptional regulator
MTPESAQRATVFAPARRALSSRVDAGLRDRVRLLRADVASALGLAPEALMPVDRSLEFAPNSLSALARTCVSRAEELGADHPCSREFYLLALDLQQLALEIHQEDLLLSTRRLNDCADGLERLRTLPSSQDLREAACEEMVNRCGFGRVVLSRVENGMWMPSMAHFAEADASWFADWVNQGIPLHGSTPEARLLTERRPAVVYDTANADVHRDIIVDSGQSSSYAVAPVMSRGTVVGFIHADHFPTNRIAGEVDRDVLWTFAEGFMRIHERAVLMERMQAQRNQVGMVLDSALSSMSAVGAAVSTATVLAPASAEVLADLTARETEVLQLMVGGITNRAIATRLVIAEDTVKSHVKQILRKLGVTNRAQAIARAAGTAPV